MRRWQRGRSCVGGLPPCHPYPASTACPPASLTLPRQAAPPPPPNCTLKRLLCGGLVIRRKQLAQAAHGVHVQRAAHWLCACGRGRGGSSSSSRGSRGAGGQVLGQRGGGGAARGMQSMHQTAVPRARAFDRLYRSCHLGRHVLWWDGHLGGGAFSGVAACWAGASAVARDSAGERRQSSCTGPAADHERAAAARSDREQQQGKRVPAAPHRGWRARGCGRCPHPPGTPASRRA